MQFVVAGQLWSDASARIFNMTLRNDFGPAVRLEDRSRAHLANLVALAGAGSIAVDSVGDHSLSAMVIEHSVLYATAPWMDSNPGPMPVDERACFLMPAFGNVEFDPLLADPDGDGWSWVPTSPAALSVGVRPSEGSLQPGQPRFFDESAEYPGAIDPFGPDWTQRWTVP